MAKVLVVDPSIADSGSLLRAIEAMGHEVSQASTAYGAISDLRSLEPDIVVLDLGPDPEEAVRLGRRLLEVGTGAALILQTGEVGRFMVEAASSLEAVGIIRRGSDAKRIEAVISRALRLSWRGRRS